MISRTNASIDWAIYSHSTWTSLVTEIRWHRELQVQSLHLPMP